MSQSMVLYSKVDRELFLQLSTTRVDSSSVPAFGDRTSNLNVLEIVAEKIQKY